MIHGVPNLRDIRMMQDIMTLLGAKIHREDSTLVIDTSNVSKVEIPEHLMREMRASVFLMGPLLGRFRKVRLFYPGRVRDRTAADQPACQGSGENRRRGARQLRVY